MVPYFHPGGMGRFYLQLDKGTYLCQVSSSRYPKSLPSASILDMGLETGKIVVYSWQEKPWFILIESDQPYGRK